MIATQFDAALREIPKEQEAYERARSRNEKNLRCAKSALQGEATEIDKIDYYRALSRSADLQRFAFNFQEAASVFSRVAEFWRSIGWEKAAFLCDLKATMCLAYHREECAGEAFDDLLARLERKGELSVYLPIYHQFRGQILAFCGDKQGARIELGMSTRKELKGKLDN